MRSLRVSGPAGRLAFVLASCLAFAACGEGEGAAGDAGPGSDLGVDAGGRDAAPADAAAGDGAAGDGAAGDAATDAAAGDAAAGDAATDAAAGDAAAGDAATGDAATDAAPGDATPDAAGSDAATDAAPGDATPDAAGSDAAADAAAGDAGPACAAPCPAGTACVDGACVCAEGALCGDACVDLETDPSACGACDRVCHPGGACAGGACDHVTVAASLGNPACFLRADGRLLCWEGPRLVPPLGLPPVRDFSTRDGHACAVTPDGALSCWGGHAPFEPREPAPTLVPGPAVAQVVVGRGFACERFVDAPGLRCRGWNPFGGRMDVADLADRADIVQLAANDASMCARFADGTVGCWGGMAPRFERVAGLAGAIDLVVGCALTAGGRVACWQGAADGAVVKPELENVVSLSASEANLCAVRDDAGRRTAHCWGSWGPGAGRFDPVPRYIAGFDGARFTFNGDETLCAAFDDGRVACLGRGFTGQSQSPIGWDAEPYVLHAACRAGHTECDGACVDLEADPLHCGGCFLACAPDARCVAGACVASDCGDGHGDCDDEAGCETDLRGDGANCGACGRVCAHGEACVDGTCADARVQVAFGDMFAVGRTADGRVLGWSDDFGPYSWQDRRAAPGETFARFVDLQGVTTVAAAGERACAVVAGGQVRCFTPPLAPGEPVPGVADAVRLSVAPEHACVVTAGGRALCWGRNVVGQVDPAGVWNEGIAEAVEPVPAIDDAVDVAAFARGTCVVRADGSVWCWGGSDEARVPAEDASRPGPLAGVERAVSLAVGGDHLCARRDDGGVLCWGRNDRGQLGRGTRTPREAPGLVPGIDDAVAVAAGADLSCALRAGGRVWCFGGNADGQLGDETRLDRAAPAPVRHLEAARHVACGGRHCCAVRRDEVLACWGAMPLYEIAPGGAARNPWETRAYVPNPVQPRAP